MLRSILISILFFSLSFSQNEEIKIAKVDVEGNEVTSKKTIIFTAGLREGQTITTADFPRAIKRLWQLNLLYLTKFLCIGHLLKSNLENRIDF